MVNLPPVCQIVHSLHQIALAKLVLSVGLFRLTPNEGILTASLCQGKHSESPLSSTVTG